MSMEKVDNEAKQRVVEITESFINESIPDYIKETASSIMSKIEKIDLKTRDEYWDIEGIVQGEDFQIFNPEIGINLRDGTLTYFCNCTDSFSGVCSHVSVVLLSLLKSFKNGKEEQPTPRTDWKQCFRSFFQSAPEPEPGNNYLIFRFYPEPKRLMVSFFRARQNKSGLSKVQNPVTLEQIINNPEWCEISSDLPNVALQIGQYLDYLGHKVEIPSGLITWFLWSIKDEFYLFWQDTDIPVRITTQSLRLQLKPILSEDGLSFDVLLSHEDKIPFSITKDDIFIYGQVPMWVMWKKTFYPVYSTLDSNLIMKLVKDPPIIHHNELSEFLDRVWSKIHASDLYGQEEFLERMKPIFVSAKYNPKIYLDEEGSLLTLTIQNVYETEHGDVIVGEINPSFQTGSYTFEGRSYLIRRDQKAEEELINKLIDMGFQTRSNSIWFLEPEGAINFLLDFYPQLVEKYRVYGEKNLSRFKVRHIKPKIVATIDTEGENQDWFDLKLEVEYDNFKVPIDKIWKAWTQGKRYIQLKDGSYASLPDSWLKRLKNKLQSMGMDPESAPKKKFKKYEAPVLDKIIDEVEEVESNTFWNSLKERIHNFEKIEQIEHPKNLNATLRPYQLQGVSFLNFLREYGFGGILADEMGLGKTLQTLALLQHVKEKGGSGPNLIIVPTSVLPNWQKEIKKFVPHMKTLVIYGAKREPLFKKIPHMDIVLTTYALIRRDLDYLLKYEYSSIILDEAQNIKNPNTITARSVRKLKTKFKVCLSGTPIENNLFELWSLFEFLMPGFLGSQHSFQKSVVKPIKDGDEEALNYLRARVKPFILRRTKKEVVKELPPKVEHVYYAALIDEQKELYAALAKRLKEQVLKNVEEKGLAKAQMSILDALLKLRQICCHPRLLKLDMPGINTNMPSGKFEAFKDLVTGIIEDGHKVLVFSQFVQMLHIIRAWLQMNKIPFAYLDGSSKDRFEQVERFNNDPSIPIFLISLKAGGTGLNLTAADYVIHYDPWWNPAVESQATDRTHRIGQTKKVFSYKLICENTVEEKILQLQQKKKGVAEAIIPGQDHWRSLTREDLEMLFEI